MSERDHYKVLREVLGMQKAAGQRCPIASSVLPPPRPSNRASAESRTVPLAIPNPPTQLQLGLGFYLDTQVRKPERDRCTCDRHTSWRPRPDGNEYCDGCGKWEGWNRRPPLEKVAPPSLPATPRSDPKPRARGATTSDAHETRFGPVTTDFPRGDVLPSPAQMAAHRDAVFARSVVSSHPELKPKTVAKATKKFSMTWATDEWQRERCVRLLANTSAPEPLVFTLNDLELRNPLNGSGGTTMGARMASNARAAKQKQAVTIYVRSLENPSVSAYLGWPVRVYLTRISPIEFDKDGLSAAFKHVRDAIAKCLGFTNDKEREGVLDWVYGWEAGGSKACKAKGLKPVHHVRVRIEVMR